LILESILAPPRAAAKGTAASAILPKSLLENMNSLYVD